MSTETESQKEGPVAAPPGEDETRPLPAGDAAERDDAAAEPEDPRARSMTRATWRYAAKRTIQEFSDDHCTDLAAALTYYSVLAIFPAAIALLSLLGLIGQGRPTVDAVLTIVTDVGGSSIADTIRPVLTSVSESPGAGATFALGVVLALWSASGYVAAFGRAMNRVYEVDEGRPMWTLRPIMLLVTIVTVILAGVAALILVLSGGIARAVGQQVGLGDTAVQVWGIAKWPVLLLIVIVVVAVLYYATPNVKPPAFRWMSLGAFVSILIWVLASVGFGFYVSNFGSYNKTYGSLAGAVVFLLWLWITNVALLFGAEIDAEVERARELQAGIPAEDAIKLEPRGTRNLVKKQEKTEEFLARGQALRHSRGSYTVPGKGE